VFRGFPYERHSSVGVNLHVLHALVRVPGYPDRARTVDRLLDYLADQQTAGLYWVDKWHISPYYATAHALRILDEVPAAHAARMEPIGRRSREWLRQTQNSDGSWGFYGQPTAEETAYALLALARGGPATAPRDRDHCATAARYLTADAQRRAGAADHSFPPLWIDKCLYTPTLVVQAVIDAALLAAARISPAIGSFYPDGWERRGTRNAREHNTARKDGCA